MNIGDEVEVRIGFLRSGERVCATILEEIGFGFLARTASSKYCSVHYSFDGTLCTAKLFDSETEARKEAELAGESIA